MLSDLGRVYPVQVVRIVQQPLTCLSLGLFQSEESSISLLEVEAGFDCFALLV